MKDIYTPRLTEILPESLLRDDKMRASAEALDFELAKLSAAVREVLHLPRLDELSGAILDHLAEQFHVDFYEPETLTDAEKRDVIRTSIAWHRLKGTRAAVEQIAATAFDGLQIAEWHEYGGEPYHFRITAESIKASPAALETLIRMLTSAKNVRSWLDAIELDYRDHIAPLQLYTGVARVVSGRKFYGLPTPTLEITPATVNVATSIVKIGRKTFGYDADDI